MGYRVEYSTNLREPYKTRLTVFPTWEKAYAWATNFALKDNAVKCTIWRCGTTRSEDIRVMDVL